MKRKSDTPLNWCSECQKFKSWEKLRLSRFIPDSEFGPEVSIYVCTDCKPDPMEADHDD
jgi:5-methylcytosine-specific restriction endonuclease McrA